MKQYKRALEYYAESARLDSTNPTVFINMAVVSIHQKQYDTAIAFCNAAIQLAPKRDGGYRVRGLAEVQKREYARALADFNRAVALDPDRQENLYARIDCYIEMNDWDSAAADGDKLIELWPTSADAHYHRGLMFVEMGKWKAALAAFDDALRLDGDHVSALCERAEIRAASPEARLRDGKRALADAMKACELTKWNAPAPLEAYALACAELGDFTTAVKVQRKVLGFAGFMADHGPDVRERLLDYQSRTPIRFLQPMPPPRKK